MTLHTHPISTPGILIPELAQKSVQVIQKHLRLTAVRASSCCPAHSQEQLGKPYCLTLAGSALPCCCSLEGCEPGIVWVKAGSVPLQRSSFQCSFKRAKIPSQKIRFLVVNLVLHEEVSTTLKSSLFGT